MPYSGNRLTPEGSSFLAGHGNHYKNTRSPLVVLENLPQFWVLTNLLLFAILQEQ